MTFRRAWFFALSGAALAVSLAAVTAHAQTSSLGILEDVGIDQKLNERVPLDLQFRDETGRAVKLGDYFGGKPVVLNLVYYECPMLCGMVLNGVLGALKPLTFDIGRDFEVVTVSFDPKDTPELASSKKQGYVKAYGRPGVAEGWHFLTGGEDSIRELTRAVGFRYAWDEKTQQWAHASAMMVLTPDGRLAQYFYGIEYPPKFVRLALVEASAGKIGGFADQVLLFCFHYDPSTGKYSLAILNLIRIGGLTTLLALGAFMVMTLRRERQEGI